MRLTFKVTLIKPRKTCLNKNILILKDPITGVKNETVKCEV